MSEFRSKNDLQTRKQLYQKISEAYPDRYPIIMDRRNTHDPLMNKQKFLVPGDATMAFIIREARSHFMSYSSTHSIIFFVGNTMVKVSDLVSMVYDKYHDEDGFLYLTYTSESIFG